MKVSSTRHVDVGAQLPSRSSSQAASIIGPAPTAIPQALRGLHEISRARPSFTVDPEVIELAPALCKAFHPVHGELALKQLEKARNSRAVEFRLQLMTCDGESLFASQAMYIDKRDPEYADRSTFGYGDIDLPEKMQNKGIGYILHYATAGVALKLRVQRVVVSNVVSDAMHTLCERIGMVNDGVPHNSYSGDPAQVFKISAVKAKGKGWQMDELP